MNWASALQSGQKIVLATSSKDSKPHGNKRSFDLDKKEKVF
ncbi:MAG: hypothetical protein Q7R97_04835 [Candidatus Daviesbacteria bacterium]|nr:hypothetical protein [Candidatus Daviesbacteria bacterium]